MRRPTRRVRAAAPSVCASAAALLVALLLMSSDPALGQGTPQSNPAFVGHPVRDERGMADRTDVVQTVDAVFTLFDARQWAAQGELFADRVDVNFSSLVRTATGR